MTRIKQVNRDWDSKLLDAFVDECNKSFCVAHGVITADPGLVTYIPLGFSFREMFASEVILALADGEIAEPSTTIGLLSDNTGNRGNFPPPPDCLPGSHFLGPCELGFGYLSRCLFGDFYRQYRCSAGNRASSCVLGGSPGIAVCTLGAHFGPVCAIGRSYGGCSLGLSYGGCSLGMLYGGACTFGRIDRFLMMGMSEPPHVQGQVEPPEVDLQYPYTVTDFNETVPVGWFNHIQDLPADTKNGHMPFSMSPARQLWFYVDSSEVAQLTMHVYVHFSLTRNELKPRPKV